MCVQIICKLLYQYKETRHTQIMDDMVSRYIISFVKLLITEMNKQIRDRFIFEYKNKISIK